MNTKEIILIGAGGHCRSCIDVIEQGGRFSIAGIVDKAEVEDKVKAEVLGYPIIGTDDDLPKLREKYAHALVTVGQIKSPNLRIKLYQRLLELDFELPTVISPLAYVSKHATVGQGTIIMHHALVNAGAHIGQNCIINTKALVEHDAIIEDHCHIATCATINGGVQVGFGTFIGGGSNIKEGVTLGKYCLAGMGLSIRKNHLQGSKILS